MRFCPVVTGRAYPEITIIDSIILKGHVYKTSSLNSILNQLDAAHIILQCLSKISFNIILSSLPRIPKFISGMQLEVFTAESLRIQVFWDVTVCCAWPWSCRHCNLSKCQGPLTRRHGFTSLKTQVLRKWCDEWWKRSGLICHQWSITCLQVHLVSEHIWCDDYLVRSFYLKNLKTGETRTVTQFHFLSWPDSGVPLSTKALLEFRRWEQF